MRTQVENMNECKIGEISLRTHKDNTLAALTYQTDQHQTIFGIVLDTKGWEVWSGTIELYPHLHEAEFMLPPLRHGQYNMWIELGKRTFIRRLQVKANLDRSWLNKLKKTFLSN